MNSEVDRVLTEHRQRALDYARAAMMAEMRAVRAEEGLAGERDRLRAEILGQLEAQRLACPEGHGEGVSGLCPWCWRNEGLRLAAAIVQGFYRADAKYLTDGKAGQGGPVP